MSQKVIVAMSGGVDSSVAAALLKEQGFDVEGVFMKNWSPDTIQSLTDCPWEQDQADAEAVCNQLGIPFRSVNFEKEYKELVVDYFISEYQKGRTPNPDIMCNKEIKFAAFLRFAEQLGGAYIATGHYARLVEHSKQKFLSRGVDTNKDQSYFLYTLGSRQLDKILLPVGSMHKDQVREYARSKNLVTSEKKDSQGICFIGHIDLQKFLAEQIKPVKGKLYLLPRLENGLTFSQRIAEARVVGMHDGVMFHTIGERMGTWMDNLAYSKYRSTNQVPPVYCIYKDIAKNAIYISDNHDDRDIYVKHILLENLHLTEQSENNDIVSKVDTLATYITTGEVSCQVRYRGKSYPVASITKGEGIDLYLHEPAWAVAAGQSVVFYQGERVIGGGVVGEVPLA